MPTIDTNGYVSEFTKKTLEQFGWQPGDPLLENTGEIIQQIRERTPASKKPGVIIDIELMTEDDVKLMRAILATAKQEKEKEKKQLELRKDMQGLVPGVQDAYKKLVAAAGAKSNATANDDVQIFDDRQAASSKVETSAPVEEKLAAPQQKEQTLPVSPPPKSAAPVRDTSAEAGVAQPLPETEFKQAFCPRCDWDMRQSYDVKINEVDKENFLTTILAGARFKKEYTLLNGKYTVVFRTLLADENRKIHRQLVLEQRANEFFSDTEWFLKFFEYRLACSIESIVVNDKIVAVIPTLDELESERLPTKMDDPALPGLVRLYSYVLKDLLGAEITRRLVGKHFREFQRLYEALEAMALEPNFW